MLVGIVLVPFLSVAHAQQAAAPKRILVLYWDNREHPADDLFSKNFQSVLESAPAGTVEYYSEYLESNRFPGENQSLLVRNYLRQKYADRTIDVVVAAADVPLSFLLKYRDTLFTNAAIVFIAARRPDAQQLAIGPGITGIIYHNAYKETLDLALKLHPNTQQVFIVSGTLEHDQKYETLCREQLRDHESSASIRYLTDLTADELSLKMKSLPERSLVLYVWQQSRTQQGNILDTRDVLAIVASAPNVPLYGVANWQVGRGIVGGYVRTIELNGTRTAEIALRIATGERAQDIPVENIPIVPMFDWRELRRWGISDDQLPFSSIVRFREPSFWDEYKWRIVSLVSLVIVQSALIVGLVINRVRRKRAEGALQQTQSELAHVGRVMITGELAATIAHEVNQPLTAVVANANAARRMLGDGKADLGEAREAIEDIITDAHRASDVVSRIRAMLTKGAHSTEPLAINKVIEEGVAIVRNDLVGKNVSLRMELADGLPKVEADPVEIQQVILNLMMNAVQAMSKVKDRDRNLVVQTARDESGGVLIEVRDSGVGIESERLEHIFDAFYTTRPEGMGMGLSICRTIVEAHGGKLWAESNEDRGATLRFTLPTPGER